VASSDAIFKAEIATASGQAASRELRPKMGPVPDKLFAGDVITFTAARERFQLGSEGEVLLDFDVGPVTVQTSVAPGEEAGQAYGRAAACAYQMFETEFQMKRGQYVARLKELDRE
jgi:hypothetical protein